MQKFTRALTREIEIAGERFAVTLDATGLTIRPVGSRRPPVALTWSEALSAAERGSDDAPSEQAEPEPPSQAGPPTPALAARPAPTGPDDLPRLLRRLETWWKRHRPRYLDGLCPGASNRQLAALANVVYQPLPDEMRTWLAWHNGQDESLIGGFIEAFHLMSAEQIGREWHRRQREPEPGWNTAWLPLLDDDQGDLIVLDTTLPGCAVREVWRGQREHPLVAPSLAAWMASFLRDVEAGRYHEDPERGEFRRV